MPKLTNPVGDENYVIGSGLPGFIPNYNSPRLTNFMGSQSQSYSIGSSLPVHVPTDFAQIVIKNSAEREQEIKVLAWNLKTKIKDQDLTRDNFSLYGQDQVFLIHGNEAVNNLGKYFLNASSIGFNKGVGKIICDQWLELGNKYLKYTIYDYMREIGMLPPLQEDPEMIRQLQRQITEMQESSRQRDVLLEQINQNNLQLIQGLTEAEHIINEKDEIIAERDNTIELQANQLQESNNIIGERDNSILQLQDEKHDLTEQVGFLTEEKVDLNQKLQNEKVLNLQITEENEKLTEKLAISELKVVPLQEKVAGLEHFNKTLEHDKEMLEIDKKILQDDKKVLQEYNIEIREDKKMMVEYNKSLQDEKNLLLVDKKYFQDLSFEQALKIAYLSQVHCNIPDHYEIIKMTGAGSNIPQNDND